MRVYEMSGFKLKKPKLLKKISKSIPKILKKNPITSLVKAANPLSIAENIENKGIEGGLKSSLNNAVKSAEGLVKNPLTNAAIGLVPGGSIALQAVSAANQAKTSLKKLKKLKKLPKLPSAVTKIANPADVFNKTKNIYQNKLNAAQTEIDALKLRLNKEIE